jgi:FAR1 DNA-binding domain
MAEINSSPQGRVGNANEEETNQGELEKIREQMQGEEGETPGTSIREKEPELVNEKPSENASGTDASAASPAPPQTLYNEYATRVAQVMRTYLNGGAVGQTASSSRGPSGSADGECCKVMMEVVRTKHCKWVVTKLDNEHNHVTEQNLGEENSNLQKLGDESIATVPTIGMEFESVEAAKVFYSEYGEKTGFKTRTGSNRRSANSGALTMQRFVCYKGDYKTGTGSNAGRMRRLYRKKLTETDEDGPVAKRTRGSRSKVEVIALQSSGEDEEETESDEGRAGKGKKGKKGKKKKKVASGAGGSLLYRLIRVPHHNNEERRRILLKYLNKRRNRSVLGRPGKVNSVIRLLGAHSCLDFN